MTLYPSSRYSQTVGRNRNRNSYRMRILMTIQKLVLSFDAFALFSIPALGATMYADASSVPKPAASMPEPAVPTLGPTVAACPDKPAAPQLLAPANGSAFRSRSATLDWKNVTCAASYFVSVKKDSVFGTIADTSSLYPSVYTTKSLPAGHTYVWNVLACNARGCKGSVWFTFTLK